MLGCHGFQFHELILTIEGLDAVDIITGQNVGVGVAVSLVDWVHQSAHVVGVGQTHGVTELMGSHHEQVVPCIDKIQHYRLALAVKNVYFFKNTCSSRNVWSMSAAKLQVSSFHLYSTRDCVVMRVSYLCWNQK